MKVRIQLQSSDQMRLPHWRQLLAGLPAEVNEGFSAAEVDIVITDALDPWNSDASDAVGRIAIEPAVDGDVALPADVSARELQLACRLLGEIVELRRAHDAAQRKHQSWKDLALEDPLTGLPNRRAWESAIEDCSQKFADAPLCVVVLDVDHFKQANDAWGHGAGDDALRYVGHRLREVIRSDDFAARIGGDEFGLLLPNLPRDRAVAVVERIRRQLGSKSQLPFPLSLSAGCCVAPATQVKATIESADRALQSAKRAGRDRTESET